MRCSYGNIHWKKCESKMRPQDSTVWYMSIYYPEKNKRLLRRGVMR